MPDARPVAAILAAGGSGQRAAPSGGGEPKQFRSLRGRPLLVWSLEMLSTAGCRPIIAVVPERSLDRARSLGQSCEGVVCVAGGATRQASVGNGLELVDSERVVVHDAARPLATSALTRSVVERLDGVDAAIAAWPIEETVKSVRDDVVLETVDRSGLWAIQTPQAFVTETLRRAHEAAVADGFTGTDDAQLVERVGGRVAVVHGERWNLKVTYPEDFDVVARLLAAPS